MSNVPTLKALFNRIGIAVAAAEESEDVIRAVLTPVQFTKMRAMIKSARLIDIDGAKVIAYCDPAELKTLAAAGLKAPRSAIEADITSRTIYTIDAPNATNLITGATWDSSANAGRGAGQIYINTGAVTIQVGRAEEFYEIKPDGDPDRPVYFVDVLLAADDERDQEALVVSAYGLTNLFRRLTSLRRTIIVQ
jgi:hypothetical protein